MVRSLRKTHKLLTTHNSFQFTINPIYDARFIPSEIQTSVSVYIQTLRATLILKCSLIVENIISYPIYRDLSKILMKSMWGDIWCF